MFTKVRRDILAEQDETRFVARLLKCRFPSRRAEAGLIFCPPQCYLEKHPSGTQLHAPGGSQIAALRSVHGRDALPLPAHACDIRTLPQRFDQRGIFVFIGASAP